MRQFLLTECGPDPLPINQRSYLGRLVQMAVSKLPFVQARRPVPESESNNYLIQLPTALKHHVILPDKLVQMGEVLRQHFKEQLVLFLKGQIAVTGNERAALRSFYELYKINPDDYDIEEARKVYRDYRDRVMKANTHHELIHSGQVNFSQLTA